MSNFCTRAFSPVTTVAFQVLGGRDHKRICLRGDCDGYPPVWDGTPANGKQFVKISSLMKTRTSLRSFSQSWSPSSPSSQVPHRLPQSIALRRWRCTERAFEKRGKNIRQVIACPSVQPCARIRAVDHASAIDRPVGQLAADIRKVPWLHAEVIRRRARVDEALIVRIQHEPGVSRAILCDRLHLNGRPARRRPRHIPEPGPPFISLAAIHIFWRQPQRRESAQDRFRDLPSFSAPDCAVHRPRRALPPDIVSPGLQTHS